MLQSIPYSSGDIGFASGGKREGILAGKLDEQAVCIVLRDHARRKQQSAIGRTPPLQLGQCRLPTSLQRRSVGYLRPQGIGGDTRRRNALPAGKGPAAAESDAATA